MRVGCSTGSACAVDEVGRGLLFLRAAVVLRAMVSGLRNKHQGCRGIDLHDGREMQHHRTSLNKRVVPHRRENCGGILMIFAQREYLR